jgi:hypothetical protein
MDYVTVCAWVYPRVAKGSTQNIAAKINAYPWDLLVSSGGVLYGEIRTVSGVWNNVVGSTPLNPNKWYFGCLSFNGSVMKIYLNGLLDGQGTHTNPGVLGKYAQPVEVGGNWGSYWLNGSIANVQIYNTALTPQEIQYLYQQGLGGGPLRLQNLVGWWPLDGDAKDYSGNNNHGTINGGVTFVQNYNPP